MKTLGEILGQIDGSTDDMVRTMIEMIRYPAIAPVNGGEGEGRKADYLMSQLQGYDSVERIDVPDDTDPSVMRSNILAKKNGRRKGTVWIIAHLDVVPAGDPELWSSPPFEPVYREGKVYGRGTEDNGQSIISSMFASRFFPKGELEGMSIGVAYVADEETTSMMGIVHLLDAGCFTEDDVLIVPDWGSPQGSEIEVSEKHLVWLNFSVRGKTTHGSTPDQGINAFRVGSFFLVDLIEELEREFCSADDIYIPSTSTFEPTKRSSTVENVNTIPGYDEFSMDIRLLPAYSIDDVVDVAKRVARRHEDATGATIEVSEVLRHVAGKPSSTDSVGYRALRDSIEEITGSAPVAVGVGGGTCANFFRQRGLDAYVWQCGGGTLHAPNEHVVLENLMTDAKVFATLYYKLCMQ